MCRQFRARSVFIAILIQNVFEHHAVHLWRCHQTWREVHEVVATIVAHQARNVWCDLFGRIPVSYVLKWMCIVCFCCAFLNALVPEMQRLGFSQQQPAALGRRVFPSVASGVALVHKWWRGKHAWTHATHIWPLCPNQEVHCCRVPPTPIVLKHGR